MSLIGPIPRFDRLFAEVGSIGFGAGLGAKLTVFLPDGVGLRLGLVSHTLK